MKINRTLFSALLFSTVLALSVLGLSERWDSERAHRQFGFLVETTEVQALARESGQSPFSLLGGLKGWGIAGVVVNELTGEDLSSGQSGLLFGPRFSMPGASGLFPASADEVLAVVGINEKKSWAGEAFTYLNEKFPGLQAGRKSGIRYLLLPRSVSELAKAGVIPDFEGLELARGKGMPVLFRPAPSLEWGPTLSSRHSRNWPKGGPRSGVSCRRGCLSWVPLKRGPSENGSG